MARVEDRPEGNAGISQRTLIIEALHRAIEDGAVSEELGQRLFDGGDAGLAKALKMPAVRQRLNDIASSLS